MPARTRSVRIPAASMAVVIERRFRGPRAPATAATAAALRRRGGGDAGSALFAASGELLGLPRGLWFEPRD
jgi:hypothetical protein